MPAVTFRPSDSIAIANCLASISVGNDFVSLGRGAEEKRSFGVSTETNQWLVNLYLAIMTAIALLAAATLICAHWGILRLISGAAPGGGILLGVAAALAGAATYMIQNRNDLADR